MSQSKRPTGKTPATDNTIRVIPLGGLGQVGMNCTAIEVGREIVVVDCGVTFPDDDTFGINLILPDWSWLLENADRIKAILLTHGHEDHIGALPFLLRELNPLPIYGTRLTLGLLKRKLSEHRLQDKCPLIEVKTRDEVKLSKALAFEFIHVNHSIPDAVAIAIYTPRGTLLHTGDWRVDHTPIEGKPIDLSTFADLGEEGVLCMLGDSTNVEVAGTSVSESQVLRGLEAAISKARGRVLVTLFSSNAHRIQGLIQIAHRLGRRVHISGRSIENMVGTARELGMMKVPSDDIFLSADEVGQVPPERVLILSTGSQAEPRSSLTRIAQDEHRQIKLRESDTVIFSARVVPGNEGKVNKVINAMWGKGVEVITPRDAPVHTTGHAYQEELKLMLNLVRPRHFVPVHGEVSMLIKHARLAQSLGIRDTCVASNGDVIVIDEDGMRRAGRVTSGQFYVDGKGAGDVTDAVLRGRSQLARGGMIVAQMVIDAESGEVVSKLSLTQRGVVEEGDPKELLDQALAHALKHLNKLKPGAMRDVAEVSDNISHSIRRFFRNHLDRKPVVIPVITLS